MSSFSRARPQPRSPASSNRAPFDVDVRGETPGTMAMPLQYLAEGATNFREGHLQLQGEYQAVLSVLLSEHSAGGQARRRSRARGGATVTTPLREPCTWNLPPRRMTARSFRTAGSGKMPFYFQFSVTAVIIFSAPTCWSFFLRFCWEKTDVYERVRTTWAVGSGKLRQ